MDASLLRDRDATSRQLNSTSYSPRGMPLNRLAAAVDAQILRPEGNAFFSRSLAGVGQDRGAAVRPGLRDSGRHLAPCRLRKRALRPRGS